MALGAGLAALAFGTADKLLELAVQLFDLRSASARHSLLEGLEGPARTENSGHQH